jgi:hypothetical protein
LENSQSKLQCVKAFCVFGFLYLPTNAEGGGTVLCILTFGVPISWLAASDCLQSFPAPVSVRSTTGFF